MARLLVIVNPVAGRGRGARIAPNVESGLADYGHTVRLHLTTHRGHAHSLSSGPDAEWCDGMVSCGGDGTLGEVINGRGDKPLPVGIVPLGTGNVLAKELGLSSQSVEAAIDPIGRWSLRTIDLGETAGGRRFSCMVSAGIDGRVIQLLEEHRRGGTMRMVDYIPLGFKALWESDYAPIRVSVNGQAIGERFGYACVANTHSFGGPIEMISEARVDDGALNVLACDAWMPMAFPALLGLALYRQTVRMPGARLGLGVHFRLAAHGRGAVPYQIDGEFAGILPVELRVMPGGLTVFARGA